MACPSHLATKRKTFSSMSCAAKTRRTSSDAKRPNQPNPTHQRTKLFPHAVASIAAMTTMNWRKRRLTTTWTTMTKTAGCRTPHPPSPASNPPTPTTEDNSKILLWGCKGVPLQLPSIAESPKSGLPKGLTLRLKKISRRSSRRGLI